MATHSSNLAWKIPWTEEPGRLQSMESQRVRATEPILYNGHSKKLTMLKCAIQWYLWHSNLYAGQEDPLEKGWQPTPVILPGKFHGERSLAGYSPWSSKELGMTE